MNPVYFERGAIDESAVWRRERRLLFYSPHAQNNCRQNIEFAKKYLEKNEMDVLKKGMQMKLQTEFDKLTKNANGSVNVSELK